MPKAPANFIYGLEYEGMVLISDYRQFCDGLLQIHPNMLIDKDSSIKNIPADYQAIEFSTEKLPEKEAFLLFEEIFCYLWIASQENIFLTNHTCGFHVNMSETEIFRKKQQLRFYANIVAKFNENRFLKKFGRFDSDYCRPFKLSNKCRTIEQIYKRIKYLDKIAPQVQRFDRVIRNKKYYAIALRENPDNEAQKNTRIEFRFMGNKDYHLREKDLTEALSYIRVVSNKSLVCA